MTGAGDAGHAEALRRYGTGPNPAGVDADELAEDQGWRQTSWPRTKPPSVFVSASSSPVT